MKLKVQLVDVRFVVIVGLQRSPGWMIPTKNFNFTGHFDQ